MSEERIEITINEDGSVDALSKGFKGPVCVEELENILGKEFASISKTDEYHQKHIKQNIQQVRN